MPTSKRFTLKVEITGLCVFVQDPDRRRFGVVMPDARRRTNMMHLDGHRAEPHVGYLRFDLANLATGASIDGHDGPVEKPHFEVIHRLHGETLDFGLTSDGTDIKDLLEVPDFDVIAPVKQLRPGLFRDPQPRGVLFRTVLTNGTLASPVETGDWTISGELRPDGAATTKQYGGVAVWERTVDAQGLTLTLTPFDQAGRSATIPLVPTDDAAGQPCINIKLANLCAMNPLEWPELEERLIRTPDVDFKWLYQLLDLGDAHDQAKYPPSLLPHPVPVLSAEQGALQDCFPGRIKAAL